MILIVHQQQFSWGCLFCSENFFTIFVPNVFTGSSLAQTSHINPVAHNETRATVGRLYHPSRYINTSNIYQIALNYCQTPCSWIMFSFNAQYWQGWTFGPAKNSLECDENIIIVLKVKCSPEYRGRTREQDCTIGSRYWIPGARNWIKLNDSFELQSLQDLLIF